MDQHNSMDQHNYRVLSRFISAFTEDDTLTAVILAEHYDTIVSGSQHNFLSDFTQMLQRARTVALQFIDARALTGKCWTERKNFFPLSNAMSEIHKEVFCLRFYRGLSEQEVSDRLHLSYEQMKIYFVQALQDISTQSIIKIHDITDF